MGFVTSEPHTQSQFPGITQEASPSSEGGARDCQSQGMRPPGPAQITFCRWNHSRASGGKGTNPTVCEAAQEHLCSSLAPLHASRAAAHRTQLTHLKEAGLVMGQLYQQTYSNFLSSVSPSSPPAWLSCFEVLKSVC